MRLIDADALIDNLTKAIPYFIDDAVTEAYVEGLGRARCEIDDSPTIEPERKKGKWNTYYHGINETPIFTYSCNQCGYSAPYELYGGKYWQKKWNFCPNCGSYNGGEEDE